MLRIILLRARKKNTQKREEVNRIESKILKFINLLELLFATFFIFFNSSFMRWKKTRPFRNHCDWTISCCCVNKSTYAYLFYCYYLLSTLVCTAVLCTMPCKYNLRFYLYNLHAFEQSVPFQL